MEYRTLEITLMSAKDLKQVRHLSKMDVYVAVSISGSDKQNRQKAETTVDEGGDTTPNWNFPVKFYVDESEIQKNHLILTFKLRCQRFRGDKGIGEVQVPIKELFYSSGENKEQFVSYQVRKSSGKPKGELKISYKFSEKVNGPAPPLLLPKDTADGTLVGAGMVGLAVGGMFSF